ncbi:MAG: hypothetical protein M3O70_15515 [Actinomycetota bacterium]|nr:hypothetical protein [Actinomycetota bacterium]
MRGDIGLRGAFARVARLPRSTGPVVSVEQRPLGGLFPPDVKPSWPRGSLTLAVLVTAGGFVVPVLRQVGASALETIWAEDGRVFLQSALSQGPLAAVSSIYAGYLHLVPRLVAEVAALLPLEQASEVITVAANGIAALCALAVFVATRPHLRSRWIRALLAVSLVLVPTSGVEVLNNVANVQWYLLIASFWLLLWRPPTALGTLGASLLLVATALSAPLSLLLAPLALARLAVTPRDRTAVPLWLFGSALAVQLVAASSSLSQAGPPVRPATMLLAYVQRVGAVAFLGQRIGGMLWVGTGWLWPLVATVGLAAVFVLGLTAGSRRTRGLVFVAGAYSLGFFLATTALRHNAEGMMWPQNVSHALGGRYTVVPLLLLYAMVAAFFDGRPRRAGDGMWRGLAGAVMLVFAVNVWVDFRTLNGRSGGPLWEEALVGARSACSAEADATVSVPITPPGWVVEVSCHELDAGVPLRDSQDDLRSDDA